MLKDYASGKISSREAARALGPNATEHDVLAGMIAAQLPIPTPPAAVIEREVATLRRLYGPQGERNS